MGFFSSKSPQKISPDAQDTVDAKIHVMQHDLEEALKRGHVKVEPTTESKESKGSAPLAKSDVSSESPFLQSDGSASNALPDISHAVHPQEIPSPLATPSREADETPSVAPLHIQAPPPTPEIRKLEISPVIQTLESEISDSSLAPKPESALKQLGSNQASLRTGTWPIGQPEKKGIQQKPSASKTIPKKVFIRRPTTDKKSLSENIILKEQWGWKQYLIIIFIVTVLGGGAFLFRKTRFPNTDFFEFSLPEIPDISLNPAAEEIRKEPEVKNDLPFSTTNTNTFLIDVETESVSTLREKLLQQAETMRNADMKEPIPFSVVDKTNTPIAFFIFASVFNLGLSGDLLNSLDNQFTLWLFLEDEAPRLALSIRIKHADNAAKYLSESEKTLPISLKNIFLAETPLEKSDPNFGDGLYRGVPVRYLNFQSEESLSIDYGFVNTELILGTSRDSTRAVIDAFLDTKSEEKL